jgi:OPA family sugar phosphate sensor protein UhpC-like MFS transporter
VAPAVDLVAARPRSLMPAVVAATLGYSLYYVCRLSISVAKGPLVGEGVLTESQLGLIGSGLFYTYAIGKCVNGFVADRVQLRRLMAAGLLVSALVNLALGTWMSFGLFVALWVVNGWFQSCGAPACVVGLARSFAKERRGFYYGVWSASHSLGEAATFVLVAWVVSRAGWAAGFRVAGLLGLAGVVLVSWRFFAAPAPAVPARSEAKGVLLNAAQRRVLADPVIWIIAAASACMYVTRYAVGSWGIFFLENAKGYAVLEASGLVSISSALGLLGTVASGWASDRWFGGDRFRPTILSGLGLFGSLAVLLLAPGRVWLVDAAALAVFGVAVGALICYLGGLMAVDIAAAGASGAALGIVGIASYVGAGTQDWISGALIERFKSGAGPAARYDFGPTALFWLAAAALSVIATLLAARIVVRRQRRPGLLAP